VIDSAQDIVRALRHQSLYRKHDTIGWGSIHLKAPFAALDRANRVVEREGVTRGALFPVRRDYGDLAKRLGCFDEARQAIREYAVVVGAKESQR
jgi:hypothetical protein